MGKGFQDREKFFYAPATLFPKWPYPSRLAIGMRFSDFKAINALELHFRVKGKMYSIETKRALELGNKYVFNTGKLPNLIPKEEFKEEGSEKEIKAKEDQPDNQRHRQLTFGETQGGAWK